MTSVILVLTPHAAFGELIRQSLARSSSDYEIKTCQSSEDALALCRLISFSIAILDADLADMPLPALGQSLQSFGIRLVVFPPQNNPRNPSIVGLHAQAYLKKPFYLPALQKTINKLLAVPAASGTPGSRQIASPTKRKKKNNKTAPVTARFPGTVELLTVETLPAGAEEEDLPEPEPTLNLAELDQLRKSWVIEAELPVVEETQNVPQTQQEPVLNFADTQPIKTIKRSTPDPTEVESIFTCMLTPLHPEIYLRFDLASALERSMHQASAQENWVLLSLSIRPTHMEWTVRTPGVTTAEEMLSYYRKFTSKNIFLQFPVYAKNDPSQDFWALEHLIQRGERSLTRQQIYAVVAASHLRSINPTAHLPIRAPETGEGTPSGSSIPPHS